MPNRSQAVVCIVVLIASLAFSGGNAPLPLNIAETVKLASDKENIGQTYTVRAWISFIDDTTICLRDKTTGMRFRTKGRNMSGFSRGDVVQVTVRTSRPPHLLSLVDVELVERRSAPPPRIMTAGQLSNAQRFDFVSVRGTPLRSVRDESDPEWNWTMLQTDSGQIAIATPVALYSLERLGDYTDADVRMSGIVIPMSTWRKRLGFGLEVRQTNAIEVLRPAPRNVSRIPEYDPNRSSLHRQRMSGVILASCRDRFYLKRDNRQIVCIQPSEGTEIPPSGTSVTVAGFAEFDPLKLQMVEAKVEIRHDRNQTPDIPSDISLEDLFTSSNRETVVNIQADRKLIRIVGTVIATESSGGIILESGKRTVKIDARALPFHDDLLPGCLLQVSGLCVAEFDNLTSAASFPRFRGFTLIPRTADDIVVLRRPPWWTAGRLLVLVAVLVFSIIATSIWNRSLKRLAVRRGRELYKEELARALAEWKVEERTRLSVELHDSISQTLTGVALQVDAAKGAGLDAKSPATRFLETARALLASCRQELRCCIWDLRSRTFEEKDLTEAVRRTLAPHAGDTDIQVRFNVPREILSETTTHDILRIVRELVINAIRHGRAQHIKVAGEFRDGQVRFSVRDDGRGFDPLSAPGARQGHFGLQGIRERIGGHNGELQIESSAGCGTKAVVSFAAAEREDNEP